MVEDFDFKEETEYQPKGGYSQTELVARHLRKIGDITCQEFTGGYWEKKPIKTQSGIMFTEEYHQDVREAYCNAVDFLIDVIYAMGDKQLREYIDKEEPINFNMDIKEKLKQKRKTFREINKMFERTNFWQKSDSSDE